MLIHRDYPYINLSVCSNSRTGVDYLLTQPTAVVASVRVTSLDRLPILVLDHIDVWHFFDDLLARVIDCEIIFVDTAG